MMKDDRSATATHACEEHLQLVSREGTYAVHGTQVPVHEQLYRCGVCGEEEYSFEQMHAVERQAGRVYREQQGYLQPEEIRALRERWGLTQAQLEDALGLGRKTVARWEAGRVLQQRSLDNLLRAIDRFPQVLSFLAARQSVEVPAVAAENGAAGAGVQLPRSLQERLAQAAETEGVDVNTLVVMILSQGVERRATNRELERVNQKLDHLDGAFAQWSGPVVVEDDPWMREHQQIQREYGRAVAS
jgi:putative zinc finger/helix-turn-helix YgiT family protein